MKKYRIIIMSIIVMGIILIGTSNHVFNIYKTTGLISRGIIKENTDEKGELKVPLSEIAAQNGNK